MVLNTQLDKFGLLVGFWSFHKVILYALDAPGRYRYSLICLPGLLRWETKLLG